MKVYWTWYVIMAGLHSAFQEDPILRQSLERMVRDVRQNGTFTGYDKSQRPFDGFLPINITVQVQVWSISAINENRFSYEISYIINEWWYDNRLKSGIDRTISSTGPPDALIWIPDLMLTNSYNNKRIENGGLIQVDPKGNTYLSQRMKATCVCTMDLTSYPMDTQYCPFALESFAHHREELRLKWHKTAITVIDGFEVSGFKYKGATHEQKALNYTMGEDVLVYDHLEVKFALERTLPYYIFRIYIPSILLMVFNIGSYWIPDSALPGRVALIVTTFLTSTLILQSVTEQTAKAATATSLHLFIVVNIAFIVLAIVEYLLILHLRAQKSNTIKPKKKRRKRQHTFSMEETLCRGTVNSIMINTTFPEGGDMWDSWENGESKINGKIEGMKQLADAAVTHVSEQRYEIHTIDKVFRIVVPILYFGFCFGYFAYYMLKT